MALQMALERFDPTARKRIGVMDVDMLGGRSRFPNLAVMKMAAYAKRKCPDATVELVESEREIGRYDCVMASKVFDFSPTPEPIQDAIDKEGLDALAVPIGEGLAREEWLMLGGTGWYYERGPRLPEEAEHIMPDYLIYEPYIRRMEAKGQGAYFAQFLGSAIGFLTRGCFRKCPFCVNRAYSHAEVVCRDAREFVQEGAKVLYLWDDNFLAVGKRRSLDLLAMLNGIGIPFQFRQGLDVRILSDEVAEALAHSRYHGDMIFAFDDLAEKDAILPKLRMWRDHSQKSTKCYVLVAFKSQGAEDIAEALERCRLLMELNIMPYITRFSAYRGSEWQGAYILLARWANQPAVVKRMTLREFAEASGESARGALALMESRGVPTAYLDMRWPKQEKEQPEPRAETEGAEA
ncbi:MAG: hypothetical protein IKR86_09135 [Candidatus Methanomethylophilaceae archaeon]|nr:hypothetical protein [Candidatus Methanomethylophilaceae archaeon]